LRIPGPNWFPGIIKQSYRGFGDFGISWIYPKLQYRKCCNLKEEERHL